MRPRRNLTKDDPVYQFILRFSQQHGRPPSPPEIAAACYLSAAGASYRIERLAESGLLKKIKPRVIAYEVVGEE